MYKLSLSLCLERWLWPASDSAAWSADNRMSESLCQRRWSFYLDVVLFSLNRLMVWPLSSDSFSTCRECFIAFYRHLYNICGEIVMLMDEVSGVIWGNLAPASLNSICLFCPTLDFYHFENVNLIHEIIELKTFYYTLFLSHRSHYITVCMKFS